MSREGPMYNFSCMDGYSIVGHDTVFCTKMGLWNASVPSCLRGTNKNRYTQ